MLRKRYIAWCGAYAMGVMALPLPLLHCSLLLIYSLIVVGTVALFVSIVERER